MAGFLTLFLFALTVIFSLFALPIRVPNEKFYSNSHDLKKHPGLYPFIGHLTFRNICDHWIDNNAESFDPDKVMPGDLIYLNIWYLQWFEENVHDQIRHPYILVTCDVGNWLPAPAINRLLYDPKLAAWFCRNMIFTRHPKLFPLPMGQDLSLFTSDPDVICDLNLIYARKPFQKKHLLYMQHFPREKGERELLSKHFEDKCYCFTRSDSSRPFEYIPRSLFYEDLAASHFVLSPLGLETDSVRTWEALALDCIPIVEHTFNDPIYEGMAVAMVHNWDEIDAAFLEKKYSELKGLSNEKAFFPYWEKKIRDVQEEVRREGFAFAKLQKTYFEKADLEVLANLISGYDRIIYKGFLSVLRPGQLANACPSSHIWLYDLWRDAKSHSFLHWYSNSSAEPLNLGNLTFVQSSYIFDGVQTEFDRLLHTTLSPYAVFLDLTYYRHSLLTDLSFRVFRHGLSIDLDELYHRLPLFTLVCGNSAKDLFVKEELERFSSNTGVNIEEVGSFWYFIVSP